MIDLDEVLGGLECDVDPFALCEVRGGGTIDMGCNDRAMLHYVLAGVGGFRIAGWPPFGVKAGDVLLTPAALSHRLSAARGGFRPRQGLPTCMPLGDDWAHHKSGSGDGGVLVACGRISASYQNIDGLFDFLHEPILADLEDDDRLRQSLEQLIDELAAPRPGARTMARALMQQCLILLLRRHCERDGNSVQWIAAARDERLWAAVRSVFAAPGAAHSLGGLAESANMSRSSFAEHFKTTFGRGPMELVKEVRLRQAARLLLTTDSSIKSVARDVGYTSRSYFTRAFTAAYGASPADYRKGGAERS